MAASGAPVSGAAGTGRMEEQTARRGKGRGTEIGRKGEGKLALKGEWDIEGHLASATLGGCYPETLHARTLCSTPCWPALRTSTRIHVIHHSHLSSLLSLSLSLPRLSVAIAGARRVCVHSSVPLVAQVCACVRVRGYRTGSSSLRGEPPSWWRAATSCLPLGPASSPLASRGRIREKGANWPAPI